jgi:aspartate carbamoyltransferase catalytic subunit
MTAKTIRHYLEFDALSADEYGYLFERSKIIKERFKRYETYHPLADRLEICFATRGNKARTHAFRSAIAKASAKVVREGVSLAMSTAG